MEDRRLLAVFALDSSYSGVHDQSLTGQARGGDDEGVEVTFALTSGTSSGVVSLDTTGAFDYTPNMHFVGVDGFGFEVSNGTDTASAFVTITITNEPPVADDGAIRVLHDQAYPDVVSATDADADMLTYSIDAGPSHGAVSLDASGNFVYEPAAGYVGPDSFTFTASDGVATDTGTVAITVYNTAPTAQDSSLTVTQDESASSLVSGSDVDGDTLSYSVAAGPSSGNLSLSADGSFVYTPSAGYTGPDSFTFTVSDTIAAATGTVTIDVVPGGGGGNSPPVADDSSVSVDQDETLSGAVSASDLDGDLLTYGVETGPANGALSLDASGSYTYTPDLGYAGADGFTFNVTDGQASDTGAVTIDVIAGGGGDNSPPVADDSSVTVNQDETYSGSVTASDADGDDLTYSAASGPANGTLSLDSSGVFTYTPFVAYVGPDSFSFEVTDGQASDSGTVTIDVIESGGGGGGNSPPEAQNTSELVLHDQTHFSFVTASDLDGDILTYTVAAGPTNGTLSLDTSGSYTYTPNASYTGPDAFTFDVTDGQGTDSGVVTISVYNTAPIAEDQTEYTLHDQPISSFVNGSDPDGDPLTYALAAGPWVGGVVSLEADGNFTFTPLSGYTGQDGFDYSVSDGLASDIGTVTIHVTNTAPIAENDRYDVPQDHTVNVAAPGVLENDSDMDGDALNASLGTGPTHGSLVLEVDGSFVYTPDPGWLGTDSFTYYANDGLTNSDLPATVTLDVKPGNPLVTSVTLEQDVYWTVEGGDGTAIAEIYNDSPQPVPANTYYVTFSADSQGIVFPDVTHAVPALAAYETVAIPLTGADFHVAPDTPAGVYTVTAKVNGTSASAPLYVVAVTDYLVERQSWDEPWAEVASTDVLWEDDDHRWTAFVEPAEAIPLITGLRWLYKAWEDANDPNIPWNEFDGGGLDEPPLGNWAVTPEVQFPALIALLQQPKQEAISRVASVAWLDLTDEQGNIAYQDGESNIEGDPFNSYALRFFPERNHPEGAVDQEGNPIDEVHNRLMVGVEIMKPIPANKVGRVYLRVFDPDHHLDGAPLDDTAPYSDGGDPNDFSPESHSPNDNMEGDVGDANGPGMLPIEATLTFNAGEQIKTSVFTVTFPQPGNNYIVVGTHVPNVLATKVHFRDDGITLFYYRNQVATNIPIYNRTELLTVWRTLWMEIDKMRAPVRQVHGGNDGAFNEDPGCNGCDDPWLDPLINPAQAALTVTSLDDALIRVEVLPAVYDMDNGGTLLGFIHNKPAQGSARFGEAVRDVVSTKEFWVVHTLAAYEHETNADNDPNGEIPIWLGYAFVEDGDASNFIYLETIRDRHDNEPPGEPQPVEKATVIERVILHEALHRFLGWHGEKGADDGIMHPDILFYGNPAQNELTPYQIREVQKRSHPR